MGSIGFIETIKEKLGILAKGRKILENDRGFQLREELGTYIANSGSKKDNIEAQKLIFGILIIDFQLIRKCPMIIRSSFLTDRLFDVYRPQYRLIIKERLWHSY